jgi:hypothetical protein
MSQDIDIARTHDSWVRAFVVRGTPVDSLPQTMAAGNATA